MSEESEVTLAKLFFYKSFRDRGEYDAVYETGVAFTGHRPPKIGGYNRSHHLRQTVYDSLHTGILEAITDGYRFFFSGMALGVDQDALEIACDLRDKEPDKNIRCIAIIPFAGQESVWPEESQHTWRLLLDRADDIICLSPKYTGPNLLQKRNEWMVDHAHRILSIWDGSTGGTANCILYAQAVHREIYNLWPERKRL